MMTQNPGWLASLALAAVLFGGCSPAQKLVGKWTVDTEKAATSVTGDHNPLAAMAAGLMQAMQVEAEFKGDGGFSVTYNVLGQTGGESGSWRYLKSDGDALVLMMKANSNATEREVRVRFIDNDHIEMIPPAGAAADSGKTLPFKRVKPA